MGFNSGFKGLTRKGIYSGTGGSGGCWQGNVPIWSTEDKTLQRYNFLFERVGGGW